MSRYFDQVQAILAGEPVLLEDRFGGVTKMHWAVTLHEGSEIRILPEIIEVRWVAALAADGYILEVAPGLIEDLLRGMGLRAVTSPIVGVYHQTPQQAGSPFPCPSRLAVWIVPGVDAIELRIRPLTDDGPPTGPIPDQGPWRLPDRLPPPPPREVRYTEFSAPRACPLCQQAATSYRILDRSLVCQACGRSFAAERLG